MKSENIDSTAVQRAWNDEGVLILEVGIDAGQFHGRYATWWNNGNRREEGRFYRGVRVGLYRWYSKNGNLLKEEDYGPGVL